MDWYIFLIVVANLLFYITSITCVWLMRRRLHRMDGNDAVNNLREALINETPQSEHRVDAATREAASGYRTCSVCAFANFKRSHFCALCGEKLSTTLTTAPLLSLAHASSRRRRARRRNEWTRKLDVEGRVFWYQRAVDPDAPSLFASVVVRFTARNTSSSKDGVTAESAVVVNSSRALDQAALATQLTLVHANDADASVFTDGSALGSRDSVQELLTLATLDFPTKFAHVVVSTASLLVPADVEFLKLSVHRAFAVEESIDHLSCIDAKHMRSTMRINFVDERGVDAGGVHREWFMLLNESVAAPAAGVLTCVNATDQSLYLNPHSRVDVGADHLSYYFALGRLVGRALLEGEALGFHLALPLLKIVLGIPVSFSDLEFFDPVMYKSMQWLLDNDNVEALALTFSVTEQRRNGDVVITNLMPLGRHVAVTDANKHSYLQRRFEYLLFESVSSQLYLFLKGLYEVIPKHVLALLDPAELDYLLSGSDAIDVADWEKHSKHSRNLRHARVLRWFWELVRAMPNEYRRRLLQFATGSSRVPIAGFAGLTSVDGRIAPFTLKGVAYETSGQYIRSHACFNRLDLPLYTDRSELERILYATLDTDAYGFTTA